MSKSVTGLLLLMSQVAGGAPTMLPMSSGMSPPAVSLNILLREISEVDNPAILSKTTELQRNIYLLSKAAPAIVELDISPWADKSWKLNSGITANRYANSEFGALSDFTQRREYVKRNPVEALLSSSSQAKREKQIDQLSPAEKYDLLVGDSEGSLAAAQWAEGQYYLSRNTLAHWMGICEGSAAASVMFSEPKKAVDLRSPSGDLIRFHSLDIKALASLLWSAYNVDIKILGSRCNTKAPSRDSHGAIIEDSCFDANPASFHIGLLNLIGANRQPMFINRVMGVEVWNVPVIGYEMRYYNPKTGLVTSTLTEAIQPLESFVNDSLRARRSQNAKMVVGVDMKVTVTNGHASLRDGSEKMEKVEIAYRYELELESTGEIIGGEWRSDPHPDFLWAIEPKFQPHTISDILLNGLEPWSGGVVPSTWIDTIRISSRKNQPLEQIVNTLVRLSK